jgi:hypothetical protein
MILLRDLSLPRKIQFFKKSFDAVSRFAVKGYSAPSDVSTLEQATGRFRKFAKIHERKT